LVKRGLKGPKAYLNHFNAEAEREGEGASDKDPGHDPDEAGSAASAD